MGEPEALETHLQSCDYALLPCTNECKNNDQIFKVLRKDLQDHLTNKCPRRQYQCPHCEEMGEHQERTTSHLKTCPKIKVPCPNSQCRVSIPHCEVAAHRLTCDYEPMSCKYAEVGCEERPLRKDLKKHEEDDELKYGIYHYKLSIQAPSNYSKATVSTFINKKTIFLIAPFRFKTRKFHKDQN